MDREPFTPEELLEWLEGFEEGSYIRKKEEGLERNKERANG